MDVSTWTLEQCQERLKEIRSMNIDALTGDEVEEISKEVEAIEKRKAVLANEVKKKKELRSKIVNREVAVTELPKPEETRSKGLNLEGYTPEEKRNAVLNSKEYRVAFSSFLRDGMEKLSAEQRTLFTHTTENTGVLLPTEIQDQIWDLVHENHCICEDIDNRRSNVVISIKKHVSIKAGKAKQVAEGVANDDEQNEFVEVNLAGKDFAKTVELSYAEQRMTNLESYIVEEIAADLAEQLAIATFAKIKTGVATGNKLSTAGVKKLEWTDLTTAFSKIKGFKKGGARKIYVNEETYYAYVCGATDADGKPLLGDKNGVNDLLKAQFKIDAAVPANEIYLGIPTQFVNNVVQDVMIETDKDIKTHKYIYSGYARMEGSLINDKAFVVLTVKQA